MSRGLLFCSCLYWPFEYFEELTRRIEDIRTSERRFYQKITDIYATSID